MRVLDLNNNYSPVGGGVRTYHHRKLDYFAQKEGWSNALMVPSDHDGIEEGPGDTFRYHVKAPALGNSGYRMVTSARRVRQVIEHYEPDVIEVGSVWLMPRLCRMANKNFGAPVVGFYHTDVPHTHVDVALRRFGERIRRRAVRQSYEAMGRIFSRFTATFGASEYVLDHLRSVGVRRLMHTPFGADVETFRPEAASADFREAVDAGDRKLVLYLSRINAEKGIDLLMDAYPHFRDPGAIRLVIGGHGSGEARLERFLAKYPEVQRIDYIPDPAGVARAFASADLFLSLGAAETFGLAVPEAMACGTPVIAPLAGGAGEQVAQAPRGAVFPPGDSRALAARVRDLEAPAPGDREALRAWVMQRYPWSRRFDHVCDCYARVVDAHQRADVDSLAT